MHLSSGLVGLLNLALHLIKTNEADEIMSRIAQCINGNQQTVYLSQVRHVWRRYFVSVWLRDRLRLNVQDLKGYAQYVREMTKKRLEEGMLKPDDVFKDKTFEEMLGELDSNTVPFTEDPDYELVDYGSDDDGENDEPSADRGENRLDTILREPATVEQIAAVEERLGQPLPGDLKDFYALTNGTRHVVKQYPGNHIFKRRFPKIQSLCWEDDDYMDDYSFVLLPESETPVSIGWPGIEGGGIAIHDRDGEGSEYVWYLNGEVVAKAKRALSEAYGDVDDTGKRALDILVKKYHGGWERLGDLKACWYQQSGGSDDTIVFHNQGVFQFGGV